MHERLPLQLYRAAQVRELDRHAIEEHGIPSRALMERAGAAAFRLLRAQWPQAQRIGVVCGPGNNGGDGYVLARHAHEAGLGVTVYAVGGAERLRGAAREAADALRAAGIEARPYVGETLSGHDVVVDALLGTGLDREVDGLPRAAIEAMNASGAPALALDIPSGLDADTGRMRGAAVHADHTVSFIGLKQGLFTADGPDCSGCVHYSSLGVPMQEFSRIEAASTRFSYQTLAHRLRPRGRGAHKGRHGHVLIIGGDHGMNGAVLLAGKAALRTGAGLVSIATRSAHAALLSLAQPELMSHGVEDAAALQPLLERATVIAIGPGMCRSPWARELLGRVLDQTRPLVVDADALNLLAQDPVQRDDWILTPHPGEAARLLGSTATQVQDDRFHAVARLQARYGGAVILKGAGSLVCDPDGGIGLCHGGNPGMAGGGMGDLLTGVVAGLVAQGMGMAESARFATAVHAAAGDLAAGEEGGERGLLAGDLLGPIHRLMNPRTEY
ncbi:MAG: NAD(P)H-hydrate dehydratase [Gammaproteobacteria bacterium]|nr:NAD(P)H-hydrate dehydratase [Gammaproteobacteria bacterium]